MTRPFSQNAKGESCFETTLRLFFARPAVAVRLFRPRPSHAGRSHRRFGRHTTLVIVTSDTGDQWLTAVQALVQRGVRAAVVLLDPTTFGGSKSPLVLFGELTASDILTYVVRRGDDLSIALSPTASGVPAWQA